MNRMRRSVKIVDAALAIHVATWLMHFPGNSGYHIFWTGTQMKMKRKVMVKAQTITNATKMRLERLEQ